MFDNDHMYNFSIGGKGRSAGITYTGNPCDGIENNITIEEANLFVGQLMYYLFDFGDCWEFKINICNIDKNAALPLEPKIIESKGESPEQYEYWDEEWE